MLRDRRCGGEKFRREYVIAPYTVDFCCVSLKFVVEVDGKDHLTEKGIQHDRERDEFLTELGYEIQRISGYDVLRDPREVSRKIAAAVETRRRP